jgi:hypothetical protein
MVIIGRGMVGVKCAGVQEESNDYWKVFISSLLPQPSKNTQFFFTTETSGGHSIRHFEK